MERKLYQILRDVINDFETGTILKELEVKKEPERRSALLVGEPLGRRSALLVGEPLGRRSALLVGVAEEPARDSRLGNRVEGFKWLGTKPIEEYLPSPSIAEAVQVGMDVLNQRRKLRENLDKLNRMGSETSRKVSKLVTEYSKKIAEKLQKEATSAKKATTESLPQSLPESWGNITLDLAKAELQDYYNQVGELRDVSKMSNEDFINEFNKYLEYQNSKLNDLYYLTKPLVIQLLELSRLELPKYTNVDLSRKEVRDILNLYGYNPYRDFTASQRHAIRKRAAGNKDLDMEWLRNFDHTLNGESLYDFFVTYRKRGGKLISNNIVERFKNRYKL